MKQVEDSKQQGGANEPKEKNEAKIGGLIRTHYHDVDWTHVMGGKWAPTDFRMMSGSGSRKYYVQIIETKTIWNLL